MSPKSRSLATRFSLPPGLLSREQVRELLRLIFDEFRWFVPIWYGTGSKDLAVPDGGSKLEVLADYYVHYGDGGINTLLVEARTERDFIYIHPAKPGVPHHTGEVSWTTSAGPAAKPDWRTRHAAQVVQLMRFLGCPLASAALWDDCRRKQTYLVPLPSGFGSELTLTVRDYSEGLAGLYWRNFFGPPFVEMFGERLAAVPEAYRKDMGHGIILVEPYPLPTDAETEAGQAREKELIGLLGPECFYDHERRLKPTRRPNLPPPPAAPPAETAAPSVSAPAPAARPRGSRLWVLYQPRAGIDLPAIDAALRAQGLSVTKAGDGLDVSYPGAPAFRVRLEAAEAVRILVQKLREDHPRARLAGCTGAIQVEVTDLAAALDEANTLIDIQLALQALAGGYLYTGWNGTLTPPQK